MTLSQPLQAVMAVLIGAALVVILTELQKRRWRSGYFSVGQLLTGFEFERQPSLGAVLGKASIPFSAGVVTALLAPSDTTVLAAAAAAAGTLALVWPVFLSMEGIPPELYGREVTLRLLHLMNVATAVVLGVAGGLLAEAAAFVGGQGLAEFGSDVVRNLAVRAIEAAFLLAIGAYSVTFQARRSRHIKEEVTGESDQPEARTHGR